MTSRSSLLLLAFALAYISGCTSRKSGKGEDSLTKEEKAICDSLEIDVSVVKELRHLSMAKIEPFHYSLGKTITKEGEIETDPIFLKGLVFRESNDKSYNIVLSLKEKLRKMGYSIFLLENNFNIDNKPDNVGILKTTDQYTVLRQIATDGINWDITNDSLVSIIKRFDKKYSLELIGASGDWCEFVIHYEPQSWAQFAEEVYKICPDVVDQGTGSVEALAAEMKRTKRLYLWWD